MGHRTGRLDLLQFEGDGLRLERSDDDGQAVWAEKLVGPVQEFIQDPANRAKQFVASRTGPYMRIDS